MLSCSEIADWSDPKDSTPPGKIIDPEVENLHGGARITYKLPEDDDILGVKAVFSYKENNKILEVFSSAYRDTIEIQGFPDTNERTVSLICIDKSRNESEPVEVKIKPLSPPVELIKESFIAQPTFGGVFARWNNEMRSNISVSVFIKDSTGLWRHQESYYSNMFADSYSFRGYDNTEREFLFQIEDRWGNNVEVINVLTPKFETEILPRNEYNQVLWSRYGWDDDSWRWRGDQGKKESNTWLKVIDGVTMGRSNTFMESAYNYLDYYDSNAPSGTTVMPMYWTIDFGQEVSLSRHRIWSRGRQPGEDYFVSGHRYYQQGFPRYYEIWGTKQKPKGPEDFNSIEESLSYWTEWGEVVGKDTWKNDWIKLMECNTNPPSGAKTSSELTVDDIIYADNGIETVVPAELTSEVVRYIRIVWKQCWDPGRRNLQFNEMKFWGDYKQ